MPELNFFQRYVEVQRQKSSDESCTARTVCNGKAQENGETVAEDNNIGDE